MILENYLKSSFIFLFSCKCYFRLGSQWHTLDLYWQNWTLDLSNLKQNKIKSFFFYGRREHYKRQTSRNKEISDFLDLLHFTNLSDILTLGYPRLDISYQRYIRLLGYIKLPISIRSLYLSYIIDKSNRTVAFTTGKFYKECKTSLKCLIVTVLLPETMNKKKSYGGNLSFLQLPPPPLGR